MAFGGVATGSINAILQLKAITKAAVIVEKPAFDAAAMRIGTRILAAAVLLTSSVRRIVIPIMKMRMTEKLKLLNNVMILFPTYSAIPVLKRVVPRESPEAKSNNVPQSIFLISS